MSNLATLKLVVAKKIRSVSPIIQRRNRLSKGLFEQIQVALAQKEGRTYTATRLRTIVSKETGQRKVVEMPKRIRQWWFPSDTGKINLTLKYGSRVIEIGKGKNAVEVGTLDELLTALQTLKSAVETGELDGQIETVSGAVRRGFGK